MRPTPSNRSKRIRSTGLGGADAAPAIRQLLDGDRFAVGADEPDEASSDLVGDGDVDTVQQVDPVAEAPLATLVGDPAGAEVPDALEGSAEPPLHLVDEPAVGEHEDVEIDIGAFLADPADELGDDLP